MQLKKSKSWGTLLSYQLNSTAHPAHLAHFCGKWAGLAELFSWLLQNGIFSIAMGADYSFKEIHIEIWVPAFFKHNKSSVATVISLFSLI